MIRLACTRCDRTVTRPVWIGGSAYGSSCAVIEGRPRERAPRGTAKRGRHAVVHAGPVRDERQLDIFAEDLAYAQRVGSLLSSISLEMPHA